MREENKSRIQLFSVVSSADGDMDLSTRFVLVIYNGSNLSSTSALNRLMLGQKALTYNIHPCQSVSQVLFSQISQGTMHGSCCDLIQFDGTVGPF